MTISFIFHSLMMVCFCLGIMSCSPAPQASSPEPDSSSKIKFDLGAIHPDGLRGRPDGLVSVSYEFCIPKEDVFREEVQRMDPSVRIYAGSRGRIGCSQDQALCIGSTHQPHWRQILLQLASRSYIEQIRECFFE
jgi:hypothetical protein